MGWVRLSDDFYDHPKFADAGPLAIALWVAGLAWSNRNLSDGLIPRSKARTLLDFDGLALVGGFSGEDVTADMVIEGLVAIGLWEVDEEAGGFRIHDFHDYQPYAADVQAKRLEVSSKRADAGRVGGLRTQQNRRSEQANKQTPSKRASKTEATGEAKIKPQAQTQVLSQSSSNSRGFPQPVDDDEEKRVKAAAKADLEARVAASGKIGKVANPQRWLEKAEADYRSGRKPLPPPEPRQFVPFFEPVVHHERGNLDVGRRAARNGRVLLGIEGLPQGEDGPLPGGSVPA